ncbi:hypothetical protein F2Q69_00027849 [Brassica cretica]|uniref:Uncharacterized protein n=1 Tax=Brassica cretica TaxID=69181 RepID=A0A8S9S3P7_BRACR|nr:hypothetical protein F2Q69_00027849 [Brassica cretica]
MENFREAINSTKGRKGKSKPPLGGVYKDVEVEEATVRVRKMVVKKAVEEMFLQWSGEADDPQHAIPKKQVDPVMKEDIQLVQPQANDIILTQASMCMDACIFCFLQQFESEQLNNLVLELFQRKKVVSQVRQPNPRSSSSLVQCPYSIDDFLELLKNNGNPIDDFTLLKSMYTNFRIRL